MPLRIGDNAPDFEMMNQNKTPVKLSDFLGKKKVVLLFYPMDFSPVCTEEFCGFGPVLDKLPDDDAVVFGVSCDHPFSHAAFKKQYGIPQDLLSDVTRKVSKAYDLFMGELPYNCSKRGTVIIDKAGKIALWKEVPTKEARQADDLINAITVETAIAQRANEGGASV